MLCSSRGLWELLSFTISDENLPDNVAEFYLRCYGRHCFGFLNRKSIEKQQNCQRSFIDLLGEELSLRSDLRNQTFL